MEKLFNYVYITTNIINGKQYIGDHSCDNLENDRYLGSGRPYFKRALKEYGKENFKKEILEFFDTKQEAFDAQEKYIKQYNTLVPNGYNISPKGGHMFKGSMSSDTKIKIGNANKISLKGIKQSKETIEKRANTLKGRPSKLKGKKQPEELVNKRAKSNTGKKRTMEQKQKMKASQQNRKPLTDEQRKCMSEMAKKRKRHPLSEETKNKISKSHLGKKQGSLSETHKLKIGKAHAGKIISNETKEKMSKAAKGKPKSKEHKIKCRKANLGKIRPKFYCNHCKKEYADYMYKLYHGEKCKSITNI